MLDEQLTQLPGLGPKRAEALGKRFGIRRVRDLVEVAPRGYVAPNQHFATSAELLHGASVAIEATVIELRARRGARGAHRSELLLELADGQRLRTTLFNQPWLARAVAEGGQLRLRGQVVAGRIPKLERAQRLDDDDVPAAAVGLRARYPKIAGVPRRALRRWIGIALEEIENVGLESAVPPALERSFDLPSRVAALREIHAPQDKLRAEAARRRLALEELCQLRRRVCLPSTTASMGPNCAIDDALDQRIRKRFPFQPTAGQDLAMRAIRKDMAASRAMARLLIGDVGTGKTAVAFYAMLAAIGNQRQALLLAPTEALARQHFETAQQWLRGSRVRTAFVFGGLPSAERQRIARAARRGELDLLIGTHALLSSRRLPRAGVLVIDEQHRFGTRQKTRMVEIAAGAHVLSMSATPIPRTWIHALWGNLDVSWLQERPPGRRPVETFVLGQQDRERALEAMRDALARGGRGLWICPRVRRRTEAATAAVEVACERLQGELPGRRLAALHGRAGADEVARVLAAFRAAELDVLVASSLIEVGMDFPAATFLVVEDADRFGLVQLHQLRGRIGRGQLEARAYLLSKADEPAERLHFLAGESEGRKVSARDLEERGPGEVLGLRQHGWRRGRFFAGKKDFDLLEAVTSAAFALETQES